MQVTRGTEKSFDPITITIESQRELEMMNHIFNCGASEDLISYCRDKSISHGNLLGFKDKIWSLLHNLKED